MTAFSILVLDTAVLLPPSCQKVGSLSVQGGTVGISKVPEAKNLVKLSLSYHADGKRRSVGGVVCFHAFGFHGWICQELH